MNNPPINKEIWTNLRQKWTTLPNISKVEFTVLRDPEDASRELAIDVAQKIDEGWVVQTVQLMMGEAYSVLGIEALTLEQLEKLAAQILSSVTVPITGEETYDEEVHLVMKRISPETAEIYGHVISKTGERIGVRTNYQHYFVLNKILEQRSKLMREEYSEVRLHRANDESGKVSFQFIKAG